MLAPRNPSRIAIGPDPDGKGYHSSPQIRVVVFYNYMLFLLCLYDGSDAMRGAVRLSV
jgi:hypothetical protein